MSTLLSTFKPSNIVLKINEVQIPMNNIQALVVREWVFDVFPRMELMFNDVFNLIEISPVKRFDKISLTMSYDKNSKANVKLDFIVMTVDFESMSAGIPVKLIQINALACPKEALINFRTSSYQKSISSEVLSNVYSRNKFELNKFVEKTNDNMTWLQCSQNDLNFVKHVCMRSFKSDDDLLYTYVDRKGFANYISVKDSSSTNKVVKFEHTDVPMPTKEDNDINYFGNYKIRDFSGVVASDSENYDSIVSYDDNGEPTQEDFYENSSKMNFLTDNPFVTREDSGYVNNEFVPRGYDNTFQNYQLNLSRREYLEKMFFSTMLTFSTVPNYDVQLSDICDVTIPVAKAKPGQKSTNYSGKYFLGGMIHQLVGTNTYQTQYALFRNCKQ